MNADTIELWHHTIAIDDADYPRYWHSLDAVEQGHAAKMGTDALRKRYVIVHGRLRRVLADILNEPPEKIRLAKAEHGKPYVADTPELAFNLSHSADVMIIAVGKNCHLGVDIEQCKSRISLDGLVGRCFGEAEIAYWQQLPDAEKTRQFYRFWTRKEAFVKATGRGIALGLERCVVNPRNPAEFLSVPDEYAPAAQWHTVDISPDQNLCAALVVDKNITAPVIRQGLLGD
ncbi:MAG: 4'-phosphopantetheinyl transferase family protein [Methylobacter sp.]